MIVGNGPHTSNVSINNAQIQEDDIVYDNIATLQYDEQLDNNNTSSFRKDNSYILKWTTQLMNNKDD